MVKTGSAIPGAKVRAIVAAPAPRAIGQPKDGGEGQNYCVETACSGADIARFIAIAGSGPLTMGQMKKIACMKAAVQSCANCGRFLCAAHALLRNKGFYPEIYYCSHCDSQIPRWDPLRG